MWKITSALIYCSLPECICKNCAEECNRCASVCIQLSSDKLGIIRFIFRELWKRCSKGGRGALRRREKKINIRHPSRQTFQLVQGFEMMRQFFLPRPFHIKTLHHIVYSKWATKYWFSERVRNIYVGMSLDDMVLVLRNINVSSQILGLCFTWCSIVWCAKYGKLCELCKIHKFVIIYSSAIIWGISLQRIAQQIGSSINVTTLKHRLICIYMHNIKLQFRAQGAAFVQSQCAVFVQRGVQWRRSVQCAVAVAVQQQRVGLACLRVCSCRRSEPSNSRWRDTGRNALQSRPN